MVGEHGLEPQDARSRVRRLAGTVLLAGTLALAISGCASGTVTNEERSCRSVGGLFSEEITCTGSVEGASGSPQLGILETDGDFDGTYRLDATIEVGEGTARVQVDTADGETVGGEVSPGEPLTLGGIVEVDEDDEEFTVALETSERGVRNLRYEAELVPQG